MREDRIRSARRAARELLRRWGAISAEHLVVESFARMLGVEIVEAQLHGASAQLVRAPGHVKIVLAERVTDVAARRFSIAHELGHFVLAHPSPSASQLCARLPRGPIVASATTVRDVEAEANAFAAELLMPESLVRRQCEVSPVSLETPRRIAEAFGVSILASAIRFAELASERCAAVLSENKVVRWVAPSATFTRRIPRGHRLDSQSLAWDYFATGTITERPSAVPADAWLDTSSSVEIIEHSIASQELGTVLSMLWIPEASAPSLGMAG